MVVSTVTRGPSKFARRPALHLIQDMSCAMRMGRVQTSVRCQPLLAADHRVLCCCERQPWAMPGVVFFVSATWHQRPLLGSLRCFVESFGSNPPDDASDRHMEEVWTTARELDI